MTTRSAAGLGGGTETQAVAGEARSMWVVDPTRTLRGNRKCEWCHCPMYTDEPVSEMTNNRTRFMVHRDCGETWLENKRAEIERCRSNIVRLQTEIDGYAEIQDGVA